MSKKLQVYASLLIIILLLGFMVWDFTRTEKADVKSAAVEENKIPDAWEVTNELPVNIGNLRAVTVSPSGKIYLAGSSFISCYDRDLRNTEWTIKTESPVTAISVYGDSLFASTIDQILVVDTTGRVAGEWGPYEKGSIITSVSAGASSVAIADAGNKIVYVLDKGGEVKRMIGQNDGQFVIPSAYFDVVVNTDNSLSVANTGHRRIEKRNAEGALQSYFGEPGLAPGAFCGCCNPAHFAAIPGGFVTAEKGLNRIKILNNEGVFVEFVSSENSFEPAAPLDIASADGQTIFAANPSNSTLYVFRRKQAVGY